MRVAILHFHLRPGGVTRVIEMACEALLQGGCEPLVIVGETPPPQCRIPGELIRVVPDLAYDVSSRRAGHLHTEVQAAMFRHWQGEADILHLHNHSLGKNFALPLAVSRWAAEGRSVLLQIHDFAENGRPGNYRRLLFELGGPAGLSCCLYPVAPRVGYAALNSADRTRLQQAGLTSSCDLLPNPVALPDGGRPVAKDELGAGRLIVYPTRAIRRKNIGEAVLWAALAAPDEKVVLTAAPQSLPDRQLHDEWKGFAESLGLPVLFNAQGLLGRPTQDFLRGADVCLTTSVAEGFGMAFLEPWLAGCPLIGRDLPAVTRDFRAAGLVLDSLYGRLDVPLDAIGREAVTALVETKIRATCESYGVNFQKEFVQVAEKVVIRPSGVDFGRLDETLQRKVIRGVARGSLPSDGISPGMPRGGSACVGPNRKIVQEHFALARYGERLGEIYRRLCSGEAATPGYLEAGRVLQAGLDFEDFYALRS